jgi:hypothetical protein
VTDKQAAQPKVDEIAQTVASVLANKWIPTEHEDKFKLQAAALISAAYAPVLAARDALREALAAILVRDGYRAHVEGDWSQCRYCNVGAFAEIKHLEGCAWTEAEAALKGSK